MNTDVIRGNWHVAKATLKKHFGNLTDDELRPAEGGNDALIDRIVRRTGRTRDEIERLLERQSPAAVSRRADVRSVPGAENLPSGGWPTDA